jgi:RNA polymerase sigma factor (sigma-70 family)
MNSTSLSLINRLQQGSDQLSWNQLLGLYKPLIWGWLRRHNTPLQDAEDLTQDVLAIVVRELPKFTHNGQKGAFRAWLRNITANRLRIYWRGNKGRSTTDWQTFADQLEDTGSELAQEWDRQHDSFLLRKLLDQMEEEFEPKTVKAFRRVALDGVKAELVSQEIGMSVVAIYIAKSRVLRRLREVAEVLID